MQKKVRVAAVVVVVAVAVIGAGAWTMRAKPAATSHSNAHPSAADPSASVSSPGSMLRSSPSSRSAAASDERPPEDVARKLAAIEAAVREGKSEELGVLTSIKLADEPEIAPAVIHAVASLASQGGPKEHDVAVGTLSRWLSTELRREGADAAGNVPNLVEALGDLGGRAAVDSLVAALGDRRSDLALDTLIVQRLGALGDPRAKDAITKFAKGIPPAAPDADPFEHELVAEAAKAADEALLRL